YQVPWFRALARRPELELTVFYCMIPTPEEQGAEFGIPFQWDVPLLDGYHHEVLRNVASHPSLVSFGGCDAPEVFERVRGFDSVIVNGWVAKACLQALLACRRRGVPCVVRGESNVLRRRPLPVRLGHRLLLRQYAAALAVGHANRDFYLRNGVPAAKIFDGPYCVDNEAFGRATEDLAPVRERIRAEWGVAPGAVALLFCGKLITKKRPLDLLRAAALAAGKGKSGSYHVLIAGEGPLRAECEALAGQLGLA